MYNIHGQNTPLTEIFNVSKPATLNGYTPKNNKLKTFPFCFLNMANNNGTTNTLQYELFQGNDNNCSFQVKGVPTPRS